jgi:cell division protein FtsZ
MFEIQEAAKVITESIDPDARVIFGAIKDTNLKKDEIKVTVIATGFPNETFGKTSGISPARNKVVAEESSEPAPQSKPSFIQELRGIKKEEKEDAEEINVDTNEDSENWSSVPAFLRRAKK